MTKLAVDSVQKLLDEGKSLSQVGKLHGMSLGAVRYWLTLHPGVTAYKSKWSTPYYSRLAIEAIQSSSSLSETLRKLGLLVKPGNFETLYRLAGRNNLDLEAIFTSNKKCLKESTSKKEKRELRAVSAYFVENSTVSRSSIKSYIIQNRLLPYRCSFCTNAGVWRDKNLILTLDHINGVNNDNRLTNLRFCCPNCNSQLPTHCGSNQRRTGRKLCATCGDSFVPHQEGSIGTVCSKCVKPRSVVIAETFCTDVLNRLKAGEDYKAIGISYGISANAIKKRLRCRGVNPPNRSGKKLKIG